MYTIWGIMTVIVASAFWFISKAILDATYFKDVDSSRKSLFIWLVSLAHLLTALGLTSLLNCIG